jgi:hypothetical protein
MPRGMKFRPLPRFGVYLIFRALLFGLLYLKDLENEPRRILDGRLSESALPLVKVETGLRRSAHAGTWHADEAR